MPSIQGFGAKILEKLFGKVELRSSGRGEYQQVTCQNFVPLQSFSIECWQKIFRGVSEGARDCTSRVQLTARGGVWHAACLERASIMPIIFRTHT